MQKHGYGSSKNPTYSKYQAMRQRCGNEKHKSFPEYGGRGITVHERWKSFENFLADVGECPGPGYSIDRIKTDGNYEPGNVKWSTKDEQANNTRRNLRVEIDGMSFDSLKKASDYFNIDYAVVKARVSRGNSIEASLRSPLVQGYKGKGLA